MLCDHLEGWDREGGREGDARGKRREKLFKEVEEPQGGREGAATNRSRREGGRNRSMLRLVVLHLARLE